MARETRVLEVSSKGRAAGGERRAAVTFHVTLPAVIRSFRHKGLKELFETGSSRKVREDLQTRALRRLDTLDHAEDLAELNLPGFDFHPLRGKPKRYSLHVNGPWCITFEWHEGDALQVDLEQYH
jgi:toxin HigB-1